MNCGQKTSFLGCVAMANGWGMWLENKSFQVVARTSSASGHDLLSENKLSFSCLRSSPKGHDLYLELT